MTAAALCTVCTAMHRQDALELKTFEIESSVRNACAPVTYYTCRCKTCGTRWHAIEVYDENGKLPSEWSWEKGATEEP